MNGVERLLLPCSLVLLVLVLFYPALFFGQVLAPERALWNFPPWSDLGGPNPTPHEPTQDVALTLAPRLALIRKHGTAVALWNPYIASGRVGWLGMAADGYPSLAVLAAFFSRGVSQWQALALLVVFFAYSGMFRLARRYLGPWPAMVTALVYTLSGPVVSVYLDTPGTLAAVVPWFLTFAFEFPRWGAVVGASVCAGLLAMSGVDGLLWLGVPFVIAGAHRSRRIPKVVAAAIALGAGLALAFPSLYLAFYGAETPGLWWFEGPPVAAALWKNLAFSPEALLDTGQPWVFFGWPVLLVAFWGVTTKSKGRFFGLGLVFLGVVAAFVPASFLPGFLSRFRPTLALALGLALLAGAGTENLLKRLPRVWHGATAALVAISCLLRLLPAAAVWLPWTNENRAELRWQDLDLTEFQGSLVLPLVTLFPPDTAAFAGIPDVRGRLLKGEPRFRGLLAPAADGTVHFSRLSDRGLLDLGVGWALEPQELSLVSGELFSQLMLAEGRPQGSQLRVAVPPGATRLGIRLPKQPTMVQLLQDGTSWILRPDTALSQEAEGWWWWLVPENVAVNEALLVVFPLEPKKNQKVMLAWDRSGWELAGEHGSVRLWRQRQSLPLVFLEGAPPGPPGFRVLVHTPSKLVIQTENPQAHSLGIRMKYRPGIQRAFVDRNPVTLQAGLFPWCRVDVPPGSHTVTVETSLPTVVWFAPIVGGIALVLTRKVHL